MREPLYRSDPAFPLVIRPQNGSLLGDTWVDPQDASSWACGHETRSWPGHTCLYELYRETQTEHDTATLYVGVAHDLFRRLSQHRGRKPWWAEAKSCMVTCFYQRSDALRHELVSIPGAIHNVVGRLAVVE